MKLLVILSVSAKSISCIPNRNVARLPAWLDRQSVFIFLPAWWQSELHIESKVNKYKHQEKESSMFSHMRSWNQVIFWHLWWKMTTWCLCPLQVSLQWWSSPSYVLWYSWSATCSVTKAPTTPMRPKAAGSLPGSRRTRPSSAPTTRKPSTNQRKSGSSNSQWRDFERGSDSSDHHPVATEMEEV